MDHPIFRFLASVFLIVAIGFTVVLMIKSKSTQEIKADIAQMNNIEYGMFNIHEWKRGISEVISEKIATFEISPINKEDVKKQIENALYSLFDDVEQSIKAEGENSFFGALKGSLVDMFVDKDALKQRIPEYADTIIEEFAKEENREGLTEMIRQKLDGFLDAEIGNEDTQVIDAVIAKHEAEGKDACNDLLSEKIRLGQNELWVFTAAIILCFIIIFLLVYKNLLKSEKWSYYILLGGILILLVAGVSTPMIDIDARIASMKIDFLGTPMIFENQILFFQSKSIMDVVVLLFENGGIQTLFVGFLILLFSVLFPVSKLISSFILVRNPELNRHKILHFLSFYSGKWSMADVMVVAIFMAYIGFNTLIESQMSELARDSGQAEIITTNFTSLQPGFLLFVVFTLSGLFLSHILFKRIKILK